MKTRVKKVPQRFGDCIECGEKNHILGPCVGGHDGLCQECRRLHDIRHRPADAPHPQRK